MAKLKTEDSIGEPASAQVFKTPARKITKKTLSARRVLLLLRL
jgi:hypothetical protein